MHKRKTRIAQIKGEKKDMRQTRSSTKPQAGFAAGKRMLLLLLLVAVAIGLSGCYMDPPDPIVDNQNGLNLGTNGQQQFDTVVTATPVPTTVPSPTPTADTSQIDWDEWNFQGGDTATIPPTNVIPVGATTPPGGTTAPVATSAAPQSTVAAGNTSTTLRSGSSGSSVSQLQQRLKELEYYSGTVDGKYGTGTANAVKAFQENNNLRADGVAGPATQTAMYAFSAVKASSTGGAPSSSGTTTTSTTTTRATPTPRPTAVPSVSGRTDVYLKIGDSNNNVKTMQTRLVALGYLSGTPDGNFQETTEAAVVAFQKRNSLYDDGVAGPQTLVKLYSSSAKKANSVVANLGALRRGTNGGAVRALQQQLKNRGYYTGSIDGDYGAATEMAVMAFQSANGLNADGVAGTATMNALYSGSGVSGSGSSSGGGSSSGSSSSNPQTYGERANINGYATISSNSGTSKTNVTSLQSVLQSRNYYSGSLDGSYGTGTTNAVSSYQRAAGLRVTGMATPATLRLLYGGSSETGSYSKLDLGSSGTAVRQLQYTLYEMMYYDGNITGTYDETTRNAVINFQQTNGLSVDGVAGEGTQRRLYSSNAIPSRR